MNLLPVTAAPANAAAPESTTETSGDFTALLAMLVGAASTTLPIGTPSGDAGSGAADPGLSTDAPPATPAADFAAASGAEQLPGAPWSAPATPPTAGPELPPAASAQAAPGPGRPLPGSDGLRPESDDALGEPGRTPLPPDRARPGSGRPPAGSGPSVPEPGRPAADAAGVPNVRHIPDAPLQHAAEAAIRHARGVPFQPAGTPPPDGTAPADPAHRPEEDGLPAAALGDGPLAGLELPATGTPQPRPDRVRSPHPAPPAGAMAAVDAPEPLRTAAALPSEEADVLPTSKIAVNPKHSEGPVLPAVAPAATARSEALGPVDAPPPAPVVPASVPEQIVSAVVPLHGRGDGRHEVTLELRPDDLGTIRVEVSVDQQTVHLTLHAAEPATSRLLSAALPELRTALADAGLTAGHVGVGLDGGGGTGHRARSQAAAGSASRSSDRSARRPETRVDPIPSRLRPAVAGRLDLFL